MGTGADLQMRVTHARVDDHSRCVKVAKARRLVYEKGAGISGTSITNILGVESMVPNSVRTTFILMSDCAEAFIAECFFNVALTVWLQLLRNLRCRPPTRIRAWSLEGCFYTSATNSLCAWW